MRGYALTVTLASVLAWGAAPLIAVAKDAPQSRAYAALGSDAQDALADCNVDAAEFDRLMALSQRAFDQDFQGGWRTVAEREGCKSVAGDLILAYMQYSHPTPPDSLGILRWHAGQMKAMAGETTQALALFAGSYESEENVEWNLYVDATLAFLDGDRDGVVVAYEALSQVKVSPEQTAARQRFLDENPTIRMPDGYLTDPVNLPVIRRLRDCFGQPYLIAYRGCETDE
ncbi:MAG: hypothetical protein AAF926_08110 [Pseudomonadota bacterium]